jgi:hypothetical protein
LQKVALRAIKGYLARGTGEEGTGMGLFALLTDVLFVGHSLVGPTLPNVLEAALRHAGDVSQVQAQIINGAPLAYNWDHSAEAEGVDAKARLADRPADVLILTEAQPIKGHVMFSFTAENVARFAGLAYEAKPDARVYVYETWPSLNSGPGTEVTDDPDAGTPWRERIALELPIWEGVVSQSSALSGHEIKLIPAGQAMGRLADSIRAGALPGIGDIKEMFSDDIHPNGKGIYFIAMVQLAVITGKSPEGLPPKVTRTWSSRDAVLTEEQARVLQQVAWEAVQSYQPSEGVSLQDPAAAPLAAPLVAAPVGGSGEDPPFPSFAPITNTHLALGLAGINDWSVEQPFLDLMKTARPWIGHLPHQFGGWEEADLVKAGALDAQGWPIKIPSEIAGISTLILTDLPEDALGVAGRYQLRYQGRGSIEVQGRAQLVSTSPGAIAFDYTPGAGAVFININAIDPADPIRQISVVRASRAALLDEGKIFNPDWLGRIRGVRGLRFMDWMATNNSSLSEVSERPLPEDYSYARKGVPVEVMVALANELQADPWFNMPHLATDGIVHKYAEVVHDQLNPVLHAEVEFSNEVWNWQFTQAQWAEAQGKTRWGQEHTWVQYYGMRAAQVADIWADVFKDAPKRLTRIVAVQTGWMGLESQILDAPLLVAEGGKPPVASFDAYAVTGYFSAMLGADSKFVAVKDWLKQSETAARDQAALNGLKGAEAEAFVIAHRYDLADKLAGKELRDGSVTGDKSDSLTYVLGEVLPYHAGVAADRGLKLMMYEGGSHVVGFGSQMEDEALTAFFTHLNFTPEMGALYAELIAGWQAQSDQPFNAFVDIYRPGKWGSWGALRHLGDDNPRWQALAKGCITC